MVGRMRIVESIRIWPLAAIVGLQGCNVIPSTGVIHEHAIAGQVVDADTALPIQGATGCGRYDKLGLKYYVQGVSQTDEQGRFSFPASPERVSLLESPDAARSPSISVLHQDYSPVQIGLMNVNEDRMLTVKMHALSAQHPGSAFINCNDDATVG